MGRGRGRRRRATTAASKSMKLVEPTRRSTTVASKSGSLVEPTRRSSMAASKSGSLAAELFLEPTGSIPHIVEALGNYGFILVLFETPSGFAIFCIDGALLFLPEAKENVWTNFANHSRARNAIWLKGFKIVENKSSAINLDTGVDIQLIGLINDCRRQAQYMAVGKPEYKEAIERHLKIRCIHNEVVMEVMWGLKNLLHTLVPGEELDLTNEDRLQRSHGLSTLLHRYGFSHVKPEMVNELIVEQAAILFDCDSVDKKHSAFLSGHGDCLKNRFGINTQGWGLFKIATALKIIYDEITASDAQEMFSKDELSKLMSLENYDGYVEYLDPKKACLIVYKDKALAHDKRSQTVIELSYLVNKAQLESLMPKKTPAQEQSNNLHEGRESA